MAKDDPTRASSAEAGADASPGTAPGAGRPGHGPGDRIGDKYRLHSLLGQGGMGDVWLAHNEALDIDVAVKLVRPASADKDAAEQLLSEARAAARLGHPAIVRVFDFGLTAEGDPFIVMERLDGEDLATALGRVGSLRPTKAVRTLLPIAHALVAAHGKGIVHRDLKPENVFLARLEGDRLQPKIVDFGIAQVDRGRGLLKGLGASVLGSPAYMAPEQARGDEVDQRGDVWSLSVVLYEAISGARPFTGDTPEAVLDAILTKEPTAPAGLDAGDPLWGIIRRGLEKDPARRYATMKELGEALAGWLLARGVTADLSGALLETAWGERPEEGGDGGLGGALPLPVMPAPAPAPQWGRATVVRPERLHERGPSPKVLGATAIVAAIAGIAAGIILGAKPRAVPSDGSSSLARPSESSSSSARSAGPRSPAAPIPVELLDQIPVDPTSAPSATGAPGGQTSQKGVAPKLRPGMFGWQAPGAPKRTLKDPFR